MRAFVKKMRYIPCSPFSSESGNDQFGWGNGYVVIPEGHPFHGKDYHQIPVEVHGGLSFSKSVDDLDWNELRDEDKGGWVVGFNTAYRGDCFEWSKDAVLKETQRLKDQLLKGS